jgi:tetratricopeptide (TPR) repeat protein
MTARLNLRCRSTSSAAISAAVIAVVVHLVGDGRAYAQSAEAEALFNDGNRLMSEGKFAQACDALEASNRVEPRAGTLILLGECREQNQQLASAWSAYKAALVRAKNPRYRALAQAKAAALEPRMSYLTVFVNEEIRLDGLALTRNGTSFDSMLWNRALPVDGGDYIIVGHAPEHAEWQTTVHVPVERARVSVEVPTLEKSSKLPSPPAPAPTSRPEPASVAEHHDHDAVHPEAIQGAPAAPRASSKLVPLVIGAGTLVLLGGGVGFELWAESTYAAAKSEMTSQPRRESLYNSANTKRHAALAFTASGLAAGGAAVWLYLRDRNREGGAMTRASVQVIPTAGGLAVAGQF